MSLKLPIQGGTEKNLQTILEKLNTYSLANHQLEGFKHFELTFEEAQTNLKLPHGLGFAPKDVIQTSLTGSGTLTWNYSLFDKTDLNLTTTGPCTVRAFIGTYQAG